MTDADWELARVLQELEREALKGRPPPPPTSREPPTIHYTELPDGAPDSPFKTEWDFYRRTVGRFLAEGHEGKWLLIKGEEIVGMWDTEEEANQVRVQRFLMEPVLMKQILTREPIIRCMRLFVPGFLKRCPS
jgi:hypothetical protein